MTHKYNRLTDLVSGRRGGYAAIIAVVLFAGMFAVGRLAPGTELDGAAPAEPAPPAVSGTPTTPAVSLLQDSAPTDAVASDTATLIVAAGLGPAQLFDFAPITDGVERMKKPAAVRGLYLNAWAAGSTAKLDRLIGIANRTEINTFVIDVKEGGEVSYESRVPLADMIGADRAYIRDVRGMLRKLRANGIYPIARIVVFKDRNLATARPDWAVQHVDGGEWRDNDGYLWVDSYNRQVWDYNVALAREAIELGFAEVQWDYVRFPDVPSSLMRKASWPAQAGRSKAAGIREFLQYSREQLAHYDVPVTADVFGLTTSAGDDMGIGQQWSSMVDATDVLLPMVYPSHYARGSYGISRPNAQPYEIVLTAMRHAVRRTKDVSNAATIRPWLQDFTLGQPRYGAAHVRAQIEAVYDAGLEEWVLWHPGSNYTVAALADAAGNAPQLELPRAAPVEVKDTIPPSGDGPLGVPVRRDSVAPPDTARVR